MTPEELKTSILLSAIQGKLTKQIETEKPISLEVFSKVKDEEVYFEIPDNWNRVLIKDVFELINGKAFKPSDWDSNGLPIVRIQNLNDGNAPYNYFSGEIEDKYLLHGGELLFSWSGTPGTSFGAYEWNGGEAVLNQHIFILHPKFEYDKQYMKIALNGELKIFIDKAHGGVGLKHITKKEFENCSLPIPPIEEQHRIVAKIDQIIPELEKYSRAYEKLELLNSKFPVDIRMSILQYAIQGRLVEQRAEEGNTEEQFFENCKKDKEKAISEGKIRKEKFRGSDGIENTPFDIPSNWEWMYISDVALFQEGPGILAKDFRKEGVPLIRIAGMQGTEVKLDGCNYLDPDMVEQKWKHFKLDIGDIVISTSASMDKIAEVSDEAEGAIPYTGLIRFKMYGGIDKEYFKWFLKSPFYMSQVNENKSGGTIKHYGPTHLRNMIIPIPPLEEQHRIVAKIEEMLPFCDRLTK